METNDVILVLGFLAFLGFLAYLAQQRQASMVEVPSSLRGGR